MNVIEPKDMPFENIVERRENAGKQYFLFSTMFLLFRKRISIFFTHRSIKLVVCKGFEFGQV